MLLQAEHRMPHGDPKDGGRITPICDLGDKEGAVVREGLSVLRAGGAHGESIPPHDSPTPHTRAPLTSRPPSHPLLHSCRFCTCMVCLSPPFADGRAFIVFVFARAPRTLCSPAVLHYTHTRVAYFPNGTEHECCECCEPIDYVEKRIRNETLHFPDDGIFSDNTIATPAWHVHPPHSPTLTHLPGPLRTLRTLRTPSAPLPRSTPQTPAVLPPEARVGCVRACRYDYYRNLSMTARARSPSAHFAFNENCAHNTTEKCSPFCEEYGHSAEACSDCASPHCSKLTPEMVDLADIHVLSEATLGYRCATEDNAHIQ